jgi:hypothetical protein
MGDNARAAGIGPSATTVEAIRLEEVCSDGVGLIGRRLCTFFQSRLKPTLLLAISWVSDQSRLTSPLGSRSYA